MITPRATRLVRVGSLRQACLAVMELATGRGRSATRRTAVLLPTHAAAEQLRRSFEARTLPAGPVMLPHLFTRDDWVRWMANYVSDAPPWLLPHEREVMLGAATRSAASEGAAPPFRLRPGLIGDLLDFYDTVRRQLRTVDDLSRLADGRFERDASVDLGAARMLAQGRFMAAAFRGYERRLADARAGDEHVFRERLLALPACPLTHVIVAVGDRASDPHGLWLADFDLLARLPGLESIDLVATDAMLDAGLLQRLRGHLPGIDERRFEHDESTGTEPHLVLPAGDSPPWMHRHRDREEELAWIVRRIKAGARRERSRPLGRTAVVYRRTLPYVYLAVRAFDGAGVPYETVDALPLASEPSAAALDLVIDLVATAFARPALVALLRSPHLSVQASGGRALDGFETAVLDRELSERRYLGDPAALRRLCDTWRAAASPSVGHAAFARQALARAADVCADLVAALAPLADDGPPSAHLATLETFLDRFGAPPPTPADLQARHLRARAAVVATIAAVGRAHSRHDDEPRPFDETAAALSRWIERQTFSPRRGTGGVTLADAHAARFGAFDVVYLAGVTQRDWAEAGGRHVFFPASMLKDLGWPEDADVRAAERAAFADLTRLAAVDTIVTTISLEDDALVEPSPLLDDLPDLGLETVREADASLPRVFAWEALADGQDDAAPLTGEAARWLAVRRHRSPAGEPRYHGMTNRPTLESYKVSALDRYVECPFVFFAEQVLRMREEPEDEEGLSPRSQGRLVHEVFEAFFQAWQEGGGGAIEPGNLAEARRLFTSIVEAHLTSLGEGDAAIERARFLGSPVTTGMGDIVLGLEAEHPARITERLLEFPLTGEASVRSPAGPVAVRLRAVADRLDLLADGTFRIYDYKLTKAPDLKSAVQLPAYAAAARARLAGRHGRTWEPSVAAYVAFGSRPHYRPLAADSSKLGDVLRDGEARLAGAIEAIERGVFPPNPRTRHRCSYCAYAGVCRKDYVDGD